MNFYHLFKDKQNNSLWLNLYISAGSLSLTFINIFLCMWKPQVTTFFLYIAFIFQEERIVLLFFFLFFFNRLLHLTNIHTSHYRSHQKRKRANMYARQKKEREMLEIFFSLSLPSFVYVYVCVEKKQKEFRFFHRHTYIHLKSV